MRAPVPADEAKRLEELRRMGVKEGLRVDGLEDYCVAAAALFDAPTALVSLIEEDRQFFLGRVGTELRGTSREIAFCAHAILTPDQPLVVPDATADTRFADNPLVTGRPGFRWYAGVPLKTRTGRAIGTLCVLDTKVRPSPSQGSLVALEALSRRVTDALWVVRRAEALARAHEQRRSAEAELKATVDRSRGVIEHLEAGVLLLDGEGDIIFVNESLCRTFNLAESPMALEGTPWFRVESRFLACLSDPDRFRDEMSLRLGEKTSAPSGRLELLDGRTLLEDYASLRRSGAMDHLWVFRDFTETRRTQRQLMTITGRAFEPTEDPSGRMLAETLRELFEADGVLLTEVDEHERVVAKVWAGLDMNIEGARRSLSTSMTGRVIERGSLMEPLDAAQVSFLSRMGLPAYAFAAAAPMRTQEGEPYGAVILYFEDPVVDDPYLLPILEVFALRASAERERLNYEADLVRARDEAEAGLRAKSAFLATMSHEIRTPLNGVLGFAELLAHTELDEEQRECVETMRESGASLLRLFDDIFDLVAFESEDGLLAREAFDPRPHLREVVMEFDRKCPEGVDIVFEDGDTPPRVWANVAGLRKVMSHLLSNALKFTEKGSVEVRLSTSDEGAWRAEVTDTGIGIGEQDLPRVFEAFAQGDSTSTRRFDGAGMGLAMAQGVTRGPWGAAPGGRTP
ncbi:MAG: histidine kinase dimerization/phospho-acceptor domain-containing protein [Myxococcota bacterium]